MLGTGWQRLHDGKRVVSPRRFMEELHSQG